MMRHVHEFYFDYVDTTLRRILPERPDEILLNGSASSLSLSSPKIYREFDLPIIKHVSALCKQAGIICHQHTCGRSRLLVEINYNETDVNVMEPLERPPGGDVELAEVKRHFGDKFCLKGNVNTFETMLNGSVEDVIREAKAGIDAAAAGGGFILSTGDQCGRDTPHENLFALVEVAKTYGRYD
jgi:uroporphyrinogen-III decarboxylase